MGPAEPCDVTSLVQASIKGDEQAWNELVRRYAGLIATVIRQYQLTGPDAQDVSQFVWLHLVEHLPRIREPAALPGWLITTTRHECLRFVRANRRAVSVDPANMAERPSEGDIDETLLAAERRQVLLDALAELPPQQRQLLIMLASEPPYSYAQISEILGIRVGGIGPTRGRAIEKLRQTRAVQSYLRGN